MHLADILSLRQTNAAGLYLSLTRRCPLSCAHCSTRSTLASEEHDGEVFLRLVGQYTSNQVDSLRDDSRTNDPILFRDPVTGKFTRSAATASNLFRLDWLFSYRPVPGTVIFAGYGSTLDDASPFTFRALARTADVFFVKLSYLFRA